MNKLNREEVYSAIDSERTYQDIRWLGDTTTSEGLHSPEEWFLYIEDYVNEAKHICSREPTQLAYPVVMDIMRKIAAMSVKAMEQHGTTKRISI